MRCNLQDAIKLFQDKKYKKAYDEFQKYLKDSSVQNSEIYKYIYFYFFFVINITQLTLSILGTSNYASKRTQS